jgi:hypothetical protein
LFGTNYGTEDALRQTTVILLLVKTRKKITKPFHYLKNIKDAVL